MQSESATDEADADIPEDLRQQFLDRILSPNRPKRPTERRHTTLGTPCARSWDDDWIARVEAAEQRLERRICGARTPGNTPCELAPNHENGRCKFHGGFDLTGAAPGNRNAVIHGLYSRRLRVCDTCCPLWDHCPCSGPDVRVLPPPQRPTCPYEQMEYNVALTDAFARAALTMRDDPMSLHLAHNVALLQVMMSRAALALRNASLIDTITTTRNTDVMGSNPISSTHETLSQKPSAHLQAFLRIANEYRHFTAMMQTQERSRLSVAEHLNHTARTMSDTELDPDRQDLMHPDAFGGINRTQQLIREAIEKALEGDDMAVSEALVKAARRSAKTRFHYQRPANGYQNNEGEYLSELAITILDKNMKESGAGFVPDNTAELEAAEARMDAVKPLEDLADLERFFLELSAAQKGP